MTEIKIDFKGLEDYEGKLYKPVWKKLITAGRAHEGLRAEWYNWTYVDSVFGGRGIRLRRMMNINGLT